MVQLHGVLKHDKVRRQVERRVLLRWWSPAREYLLSCFLTSTDTSFYTTRMTDCPVRCVSAASVISAFSSYAMTSDQTTRVAPTVVFVERHGPVIMIHNGRYADDGGDRLHVDPCTHRHVA